MQPASPPRGSECNAPSARTNVLDPDLKTGGQCSAACLQARSMVALRHHVPQPHPRRALLQSARPPRVHQPRLQRAPQEPRGVLDPSFTIYPGTMCRSRVFDVCSTYCGTTRHSRVLDVASTTTSARPWARTTSTRPRRPLLYYYQSEALCPHDKHEATRPLPYYYQSEALRPHDKHEIGRAHV